MYKTVTSFQYHNRSFKETWVQAREISAHGEWQYFEFAKIKHTKAMPPAARWATLRAAFKVFLPNVASPPLPPEACFFPIFNHRRQSS